MRPKKIHKFRVITTATKSLKITSHFNQVKALFWVIEDKQWIQLHSGARCLTFPQFLPLPTACLTTDVSVTLSDDPVYSRPAWWLHSDSIKCYFPRDFILKFNISRSHGGADSPWSKSVSMTLTSVSLLPAKLVRGLLAVFFG